MIRVIIFNKTTQEQVEGGVELIDVWKQTPGSSIWVDLWDERKDDEAILLKEKFNVPRMAIEDSQRERHPAKIRNFANQTFLLIKGLSKETVDTKFSTIQLAFFIGENFLITRHNETAVSVDKMWSKTLKENLLGKKATGGIALDIARYVMERFLPILLDLESQFDNIEYEMLSRPDDVLLHQLVEYKSNLKKLRRIMEYHIQVVTELKQKNWPGITQKDQEDIPILHEKLERLYSLSNFYYEHATDLQDGYISMASHRLNQIVKVLTIITVIFIPLSFLAGLYGMNFVNMPELQLKYAYFILLAVMAAIVVGLIIVFKRKHWL